MAGSTRARRRLSLLSGGSLAAATLMSAATVTAPAPALAANECGAVVVGGNDCTGTQAGISYTTATNIALRMNNGVATTASGVAITATGTATVGITRVDTPAGSGDPSLVSTGGPGVQVTAATGAITVNLSDTDTGDAPLAVSGTSFGVQLSTASTAAAAISLTTTNGQISASSGVGVQASSNSASSGNVSLTLGGGVSGTTGAVQTTVAGTGTTTIALTAQSSSVSGQAVTSTAGPAVQILFGAGGGAATLTVGGARTVQGGTSTAVIDIANAGGARTVTNNGAIRSSDTTAGGYDDLAISVGAGTGAVTIANTTLNTTNTATNALYAAASLTGRLSLLNTGTATITNGAVGRVDGGSIWRTTGTNTLGAGDTTLNNNTATFTPTDGLLTRVNAVLATGAGATTLDFGAGTDTFTNAGILAAGEGSTGASTLTLLGLETWNSQRDILFGSNGAFTGSDGAANDRIVAATTFVASGTSRLFMDVDFSGSQASCAAAVTADCFDLRGSTITGTLNTSIVVNTVGSGRSLGRIVLVDVGGGITPTVAFGLDAGSPDYAVNDDGDGYIDTPGMLHYDLRFDAGALQFYLLGAPDTEAFEFAALPAVARASWDSVTGVWFDRPGDLRLDRDHRGGVWLKATGAQIDQAMTQSYVSAGVTDYDTGYSQDVRTVTGGADLVSLGGERLVFVAGLTVGHTDSSARFVGSPTMVDLKGYSLGAYASVFTGPVFVDAIVNAVTQDMTYASADLGLASDDGQAKSLGFQAEGGLRYDVPEMRVHLEPLVSLAYVRTQLDDLTLSDLAAGDLAVGFEDVSSLRAGVGLRLSGDVETAGWTTRVAFTGRIWQEFDAEAAADLAGAGYALPLAYDDASDTTGEFGFSLSTLGMDDRLSFHLDARLQHRSDYESREVSLGGRYAF